MAPFGRPHRGAPAHRTGRPPRSTIRRVWLSARYVRIEPRSVRVGDSTNSRPAAGGAPMSVQTGSTNMSGFVGRQAGGAVGKGVGGLVPGLLAGLVSGLGRPVAAAADTTRRRWRKRRDRAAIRKDWRS